MKLLTLIALLSIAGCDVVQLPYSETDSRSVVKSVFIQFNDGTDTVMACDRIVYDILRGEKIRFYNDADEITILINQIKYFKYE